MAIVSALIDSREPDWVQKLTFGNVPTIVTMLDAGDLLLTLDTGDMLIVERKTANDFLNTLRDDRLFPQLVRMKEVTPWTYLAICGTIAPGPAGKAFVNGVESGWNWASVAGAYLTCQEIGVHIYPVASDHEFEQSIIRLANRDRSTLRVRPAREATFVSEAEALLTALPGIGPEKAQALLAYAGSPAWALAYLSNDEWTGPTAPGVGEGIRRKIRRALELPEWATLAVCTKDGEKPVEFQPAKGQQELVR